MLMAARAVRGRSAAGGSRPWRWSPAVAPPGHRGEALGDTLGATSAGSIAGPALGVTASCLVRPFLIFCGLALAQWVAPLAVLPPEDGLPRPCPRPASSAPRGRGRRLGGGVYWRCLLSASSSGGAARLCLGLSSCVGSCSPPRSRSTARIAAGWPAEIGAAAAARGPGLTPPPRCWRSGPAESAAPRSSHLRRVRPHAGGIGAVARRKAATPAAVGGS
jgi:hypothetical protein